MKRIAEVGVNGKVRRCFYVEDRLADAILADNSFKDVTEETFINEDDIYIAKRVQIYRANAIARVKADASRIILGYYGIVDGKQGNMQKRATELVRLRLVNGGLTPEEAEEETTLLAVGNWVDRVRAASLAAETQINGAVTVVGILAVVPNWPVDVPPPWPKI
jgi:hypothetical protein